MLHIKAKFLHGFHKRFPVSQINTDKTVRAHILDFKTDHAPNTQRHRPQMEDYRKAVSLLFALPPARIACSLLFVRPAIAADL